MATLELETLSTEISNKTQKLCFHCKDNVPPKSHYVFDNKSFCCTGCQTVYQILNENNLCDFYSIDAAAGLSQKLRRDNNQYNYLNDKSVSDKLIDFQDETKTKITFLLPTIHCASCIWLLENLFKLNTAISNSKVNFLKKEVSIVFNHNQLALSDVVKLLSNIGYPPEINLNDLEHDKTQNIKISKTLIYQIGVAGFAFGNIMLLSFPEYFGLSQSLDKNFAPIFGYINLIIATPVLVFSARDYFKSAYLGLKNRHLNIDVPLVMGMIALYGRSAYEILSQSGAGFMDSFAGLIFFLLLGKYFQQKTFNHISFERDYKSYFPISATVKTADGKENSVALNKLNIGDTLILKNGEIIPADGILIKGETKIDYAFVTGEAEPILKKSGEKIFAGGRLVGSSIESTLTRNVNQSYLTQLWNNDAFKNQHKSSISYLSERAGRYFTVVILVVSALAFLFWVRTDFRIAINAATAVLIIACPCAVALSIPFTLGNLLRIFGRHQFYLKNTNVIEALGKIDAIVFDKTGTITQNSNITVEYVGEPLSQYEESLVYSLAKLSNHVYSAALTKHLSENNFFEVEAYIEKIGSGIEGIIDGKSVKLGSAQFINGDEFDNREGQVYIKIDKKIKGFYKIRLNFREGLKDVIQFFIKAHRDIYLLSGDNDNARAFLSPFFSDKNLHFNQTPFDKLHFIKDLQSKNQKVLMLGDGLNDAGALQQSDVGIVVSENTNNFSPACDGILQADKFSELPKLIQLATAGTRIVNRAYLLAFCYNIVGLSYAVSGNLHPIIAAILMPLSSVSIVLFGVLSGNWAEKLKVKN